MKTSPIGIAARAKGPAALVRRSRAIQRSYGTTTASMDSALDLYVGILSEFNCGASFPLTAATLERHPDSITKYLDRNIEFIVHGLTHIDYSRQAPSQILRDLRMARGIFSKAGIAAAGFRSPYLRRSPHLNRAIEGAGFSYASNQPIVWDVLDPDQLDQRAQESYGRALDFYAPWHAAARPSVPSFSGNLLEIPVSLPDDEILIDRLGGEARDLVETVWKRILAETHQLGELFTLQLHPERISLCKDALVAVLAEASALTPAVWLARLDEISTWWHARATTAVEIGEASDGTLQLSVAGPPGTTILARGVEVLGLAQPWADDSWQAASTSCTVRAARRPFIGLSPSCPSALGSFLRQQGYVCEVSREHAAYTVYLDGPDFCPEAERPLLAKIEKGTAPLVRLGRWPDGARSALCVTGDIDALTIWDYALRALGK